MARPDGEVTDRHPEATEDNEVIRQLIKDITSGRHWYLALLEAINRWDITEETHENRDYRYLISGEAFDWLLLAERLCQAVDGYLPGPEMTSLLFNGEPPLDITAEEFKELIGETKYNRYLNYYYGITVEEALVIEVQEEIRKERRLAGLYREKDTINEAFRRIYGSSRTVMLRKFRKEKRYPQSKSIRLHELKEFTYWLFKHRLKQSDKARVASDTRKGLDWLKSKGDTRQPENSPPETEIIDVLPYGLRY
jgi:hypothetical protein